MQQPQGARAHQEPRGRPGTPSLLRELNDRAALDLLLRGQTLTRSQISEYTGVSRVTVAQMLARLEERGLVAIVGEQAGNRGPNAALYSVVPSSAYVAGLYIEADLVSAAVADVTGRRVADVSVNPNGAEDPVEVVLGVVERACARAGVDVATLRALVIGSPGVVDPRTGDPRLAVNLPAWHEGALDALRGVLHTPVVIENDVNLAAMAERAAGAAVGADDFVLVWLGGGLGLATILGGQLHRGTAGAAGEIGYLPVHGAPLPSDIRHPASGGLQWLAGGSGVRTLAASYGFTAPTAAEAVQAAVADAHTPRAVAPQPEASQVGASRPEASQVGAPQPEASQVGASRPEASQIGASRPEASQVGASRPEASQIGASRPEAGSSGVAAATFLDDLAHRVAVGVASVCVVLDPGLVVLGGEVGRAGGAALASRVAAEVAGICPARPRVVPTGVPDEPVLRGAMLAAVGLARAALLASVADPQ
jgi:predicted NBD/HSP70 family sugar kinase